MTIQKKSLLSSLNTTKKAIVASNSAEETPKMGAAVVGRNTIGRNTVGRNTVGRNTVGRNTIGRNTVGRNTIGRVRQS